MKENKKLVNFRKAIIKTQEEMASLLGVSVSYYQKIENGERNPSFNFINRFRTAFNDADIETLFFREKPHTKCS